MSVSSPNRWGWHPAKTQEKLDVSAAAICQAMGTRAEALGPGHPHVVLTHRSVSCKLATLEMGVCVSSCIKGHQLGTTKVGMLVQLSV